ncbi:MAG: hypothetical protein KDD60_08130, partial [Bdellovibrionales bacterium]|nr:hypothetical protein [Bdellovibrionales bacterium]
MPNPSESQPNGERTSSNIGKPLTSAQPPGPRFTENILREVTYDRTLRTKLRSYVESFGIEYSELDPRGVRVMVMARELESFIDSFSISVASQDSSNGDNDFIVQDDNVPEELEITEEESVQSAVPADSIDFVPIRGPSDLPYIPLHEYMYEEVVPDYFWKRVINREILKQEWRVARDIPVTSVEQYPKTVISEKEGINPRRYQHAIVLFDASTSMFKDDGRGEFAKGLALAFLKKAFEQRSTLHFYSFGAYVSPAKKAVSPVQFADLTRRILFMRAIPGNGIQEALETGVNCIRHEPDLRNSDIMLITDGRSELRSNPLGELRLHTFRVFGSEDRIPQEYLEKRRELMLRGVVFKGEPSVPDGRTKLKAWSTNYRDINTKEIPSLVTPIPDEVNTLI